LKVEACDYCRSDVWRANRTKLGLKGICAIFASLLDKMRQSNQAGIERVVDQHHVSRLDQGANRTKLGLKALAICQLVPTFTKRQSNQAGIERLLNG